VVVRDGRFELHGLDPSERYPVSFIDPKNKLGATVTLSARDAAEEVAVRLEPCGSATVRRVDANGKPVVGRPVLLEVVVTPGSSPNDAGVSEAGKLSGDCDFVGSFDRLNHWQPPTTDADGRVTFTALIPGATYRIMQVTDKGRTLEKGFTVESGKLLRLPDVGFPKRPR
jgi:hypothetical protein